MTYTDSQFVALMQERVRLLSTIVNGIDWDDFQNSHPELF